MAMWATARSGDWLTPERMRAYPLILLTLFSLATGGAALLSHDRMGPNNLPLGSDFSQVWVAGREVLAGRPEAPFDIDRHAAAQRAEFASASGVFGWHYPPYFLAPAALLARLPYLQALFVWQFATLALYLAAMLAILRGSNLSRASILIAALAYPAVALNLGHGQNGFLTAALLGGGFALLQRRPGLAGALFALLAYKPQFGLALPLFLLMSASWRAIGATVATLAVMTAASVVAFGLESWRAFFDSLPFIRTVVVEQGATGFEKIQTVFAAVRLMGGDIATAYFWQSVAGASAFAALAFLLRSPADWRVKAAATIGAALLTTPYSLDYDMMALAPAMALLLAHGLEKGFAPFEKTVLAMAYAAPLLARPIASLLPAPLGVAALVAFFATTVSHAFSSTKQ
jgi:hypothetical protein